MRAEIWETNRRIRSHILSHTRSVSHLTVQLVLVNAVRSGRLANVAGSARKHQTVVDTVFFGIKQVGAVKNLLVDYRRGGGSTEKATYHSRQKRKWIWSDLLSPPAEGDGLADMLFESWKVILCVN